MATWHITVKPTVRARPGFTQIAIDALVLAPVRYYFEQSGFTVSPMPEYHSSAFTVCHPSERAMTLFMLRYDVAHIDIERVV
jgi:hypothetical protein